MPPAVDWAVARSALLRGRWTWAGLSLRVPAVPATLILVGRRRLPRPLGRGPERPVAAPWLARGVLVVVFS